MKNISEQFYLLVELQAEDLRLPKFEISQVFFKTFAKIINS